MPDESDHREIRVQQGRLLRLGVWYAALTWAGFAAAWNMASLAVGISECQLAIGVLIGFVPLLRAQWRFPLALLFVATGFAIQYVTYVSLWYPMVGSEDYLSASGWMALLASAMWWMHRRRTTESRAEEWQFRLLDCAFAIAVAAVMLAVWRSAIQQTNVGGMSDPWETVELPTLRDWQRGALPYVLASSLIAANFGFSLLILTCDRPCWIKGVLLAWMQASALAGEWLLASEIGNGDTPLHTEATWMPLSTMNLIHFPQSNEPDDVVAILPAILLLTRAGVLSVPVWILTAKVPEGRAAVINDR
jgi:hypothetical protein